MTENMAKSATEKINIPLMHVGLLVGVAVSVTLSVTAVALSLHYEDRIAALERECWRTRDLNVRHMVITSSNIKFWIV